MQLATARCAPRPPLSTACHPPPPPFIASQIAGGLQSIQFVWAAEYCPSVNATNTTDFNFTANITTPLPPPEEPPTTLIIETPSPPPPSPPASFTPLEGPPEPPPSPEPELPPPPAPQPPPTYKIPQGGVKGKTIRGRGARRGEGRGGMQNFGGGVGHWELS